MSWILGTCPPEVTWQVAFNNPVQSCLGLLALLECLTKYSAHRAETRIANYRLHEQLNTVSISATSTHTIEASMELAYWSTFLALAVGAVCWTASQWLASKRSGEQQC